MKKLLLLLSIIFLLFVSTHAASRYWVSSGASNWNNTANWSATSNGSGGQTVPGSGDIAYFDGAGGKNGNCSMDATVNVAGINISGYSGTVTQGSGYTITVGASNFTQSTGTFTGGNSSIDINGGFYLSGGTFNSTSGNLYVSGYWSHTTAGTFNHNNGTTTFDGSGTQQLWVVSGSETFYNIVMDKTSGGAMAFVSSSDKVVCIGTLTLSQGTIGSWSGTPASVEVQGDVNVLNTFGTLSEYITLKFTGTATQSFDLTNATSKIDGTIAIDKSSGQVNLISALTLDANKGLSFISGTLNLNGQTVSSTVANTTCSGSFTIAGTGTLTNYGWSQTSSSAALNISSSPTFTIGAGNFNQSNGTFNNGSTDIDINGGFYLSGGTFNATSGTMYVSGYWSHTTAGTFNHNNGTVTFDGTGTQQLWVVSGAETFYNLDFNKSSGHSLSFVSNNDKIVCIGTLTLSQGTFGSWNGTPAAVEAQGNVTVLNTFGTLSQYLELKFTGTSNQNFDLTNATNKVDGSISINKASGQVNLISNLTMDGSGGLILTAGTLNIDGYTLSNTVASTTFSGVFTLTGSGTLANYGWSQSSPSSDITIVGSPTFTVGAGNFIQSNGTFTGGSANIDMNCNFYLSGGTFTAPSGTMYLSGTWSHTTAGTFNHNSGTVSFDGTGTSQLWVVGGSESFYNVIIDKTSGGSLSFVSASDKIICNGTLTLSQGTFGSWSGTPQTVEAKGDVTVLSAFGTLSEYLALDFTGSASIQTLTFTGTTTRIQGNITVNKTSGKVNLGSGVTVYSGKTFTVTAGTLNCLNQVVSGPTFTLASGATLELGSTGGIASSGATGNIQTTTRTFNTGSYYVYSGISGAQVTGTGLPSTIVGLTINNSSGVTLTASETINTLFTLTSGNLTIGAFNVVMASGSSISSGSSSSFVYTGSTGFLKYLSCAASSTKSFPVGHTNSSAGYIPLIITFNVGHTTDDFSVLAVDKVTNDGTRNGTAYTSTVVKSMWFITETTSGGSNVNMQFQWNTADEAAGFDRSICRMAHHTGSAWENPGSLASATGSDPYTFTHSSYTGTFSPFGMGGSGGPLPVKLLYFNAKKDNRVGRLNWATAAEMNNDYFTVEKSLDGKIFKSIGKIIGAGNIQQIIKYSFTDSNLSQGMNYYRLKQTDYNGEFSYSQVEIISNNSERTDNLKINLYPVPASAKINLDLNGPSDIETPLRIINVLGKTVLEKNTFLQSGYNHIEIDLNELSGGIYYILFDGIEGFKSSRFLVNK